jgi:hypothetical protein
MAHNVIHIMKTYQSIINKTKQQQRGGGGTRWKDPSLDKQIIFQKRSTTRGIRTNQISKPLSCGKHIR